MLELIENIANIALAFIIFIFLALIFLSLWEFIKDLRRKKDDPYKKDKEEKLHDEKLELLISKYLSLNPVQTTEDIFFKNLCDELCLDIVQIKNEDDIDLILELNDYIFYKNHNELPSDRSRYNNRKSCLDSLHNKTPIVISIDSDDYDYFQILYTMREFKEHLSKFE